MTAWVKRDGITLDWDEVPEHVKNHIAESGRAYGEVGHGGCLYEWTRW